MQFRVLTLNLLGIPVVSEQFDFRMRAIPLEIGKLDCDIVCFQEVWTVALKKRLVEEMQPQGFIYCACEEVIGRIRGGLVTFSKHEIEDLCFNKFENWSVYWGDKLVDEFGFYKGFLDARILFKEGEIALINLHLSANYSDEFVRQNEYFKQVEAQVSTLIPYVEKISHNLPVIMAGDFNLAPHSLFYGKITRHLNLIDSMNNSQEPTELPYALSRVHKLSNRKISRRADYIFIRKRPKTKINGEIVLNDKYLTPEGEEVYLSDHFAVVADISFAQ